MISAVIPVDLDRRPISLLYRLNRLLSAAHDQGLQVAIGHNDRGSAYDSMLKAICTRHKVRLATGRFYEGEVNSALLRNAGMRIVDTCLTLLLDADIYLQVDVLQKMICAVNSEKKPFQIIPCLYLSRQGSSKLIRRRTNSDQLLSSYLQFKRSHFLHLAVPSSVVLFQTEDFERAGGFDEGFRGHGYEDLDFLLRLAWLHGEIPKNETLLADTPVRAPLLASGFRSQLARLTLPALLNRQIAFHLWHSSKKDRYYEARERNAETFKSKLMSQLQIPESKASELRAPPPLDLTLIDAWSEMCRGKNVDAREYSILFDNRPGHTDRFDTPMRRMKYLLGKF